MSFNYRDRSSLTHFQRDGLVALANLADGHVRRAPVASERPIIQSLQEIYNLSLGYDVLDLEEKFVASYLGLSRQKIPHDATPLVFFSASEAIAVAARVMAEHQESCAVLEPTFDIIPMLLKSTGVPVAPFEEVLLHDPEELAKRVSRCSAIFVTLPNNPTGLVLDEDAFRRLCDMCARTKKSLIIDACFRLYAPPAYFNYYQILTDSGIDWMVIEDTGKIWAANGLKAGILTCSDKLAAAGSRAFHDLVLSVSPFILTLLWQLSERGGTRAIHEMKDLIENNRAIVHSLLSDSAVFVTDKDKTQLPLENVYYDTGRFPDQAALIDLLRDRGLAVLGSEGFYWSSGAHRPFIRLALSRDEETVRQGARVLATVQ